MQPEKLTLNEWLIKYKMSASCLAILLDCTEQTVHNWKNEKFRPHNLFRKKLKQITRDEVKI